MSSRRERFQVMGAGICSLILVLGVARFAYTPLLPLMQQQAGLGVGEAGLLAAINYGGYLSGALIASLISDLVLKDRLYRIGMVLAIASTALMGLTTDVTVWAVSRFVAGLSSAAGMLLGTGLILNWLIRHDHRSELGIHFSGIGLGIAGCAAAVLLMSPWFDWRGQWLIFALLGGMLLVPALRWLPAPDPSPFTKSGEALRDQPPGRLFMRLFMAAYFCAGVGYVVSATFIVAIVDRLPGLAGQGALVFLAIGAGMGKHVESPARDAAKVLDAVNLLRDTSSAALRLPSMPSCASSDSSVARAWRINVCGMPARRATCTP